MLSNEALLTDLYQLTMAQGYEKTGLANREACFYLHFRENPFKGGYAVACGFAQLAEFIEDFHFTADDCAYLTTLKTAQGNPLFSADFINSLASLTLTIDVDAVAEGTVVFPYEPIARVKGPILQCQLVETALLNLINFQTLIATKAARVCEVAKGPVAEFGLRRAQGPAGGLLASRAAIVGGCTSTSNVEAGRVFDLPVSGTHGHSWVMAHESELAAFRAFVEVFPDNSTVLVDTYDVLKGVRNAITVAHEMETRAQRLAGIRIDSGDLAWLSIKARELLDEEGLDYVRIVASNDLDEYTIQSLHEQGARIDSWGVGTRLATAWEQPALSGVYKLCAMRSADDAADDAAGDTVGGAADGDAADDATASRAAGGGRWMPQLKVTEQVAKATLPGLLAVRRYFDEQNIFVGDMIFDERMTPKDGLIIDPFDDLRRKNLSSYSFVGLLEPFIQRGRLVGTKMNALQARQNTHANLKRLHPTNKRLLNPHSYPVGLEHSLLVQRDTMLRQAHPLD
ncbi:MAG: nicotinate phosphoribosyltransferase [Coriobacteriales bacterium]|jgi:nicotinate phosphoribosyltransferase|nr:nicotinate phosphoribosyltransferase [Coriobacteriales bacterium]